MILSQVNKKERHFFLLKIIVACSLLSTTINNAYAQTPRSKKEDTQAEALSFKERWGIKTNAVDWLLTVPNIGVEFDLGNTIRNKHTIGANLKWNWNTSQKYTPSTIFNMFDARVEWRQYFRTRQRGGVTKDANIFTRLKETVLTTQRKSPRQNRAYYWGIYTNASTYNIKLGKEGKQGTAYGAGLSLGFTAPLYGYRNHSIDLEMGGSIGLLYTSYDVYKHDAESNCYPRIDAKSKGGHLVPFPMVTDLRVAFVYRFMSVNNKYKESIERRAVKLSNKRNAINAQINQMRVRIDSINNAARKQGISISDSVLTKEERKEWKKMQHETSLKAKEDAEKKLQKQIADSLGIQLNDTVPLTKEQQKAIRKTEKAIKEAAAKEIKAQKNKEEKEKEAVEKSKKSSKKDLKESKESKESKDQKGQKDQKKKKKKGNTEAVKDDNTGSAPTKADKAEAKEGGV